jgi:hypothetical protein
MLTGLLRLPVSTNPLATITTIVPTCWATLRCAAWATTVDTGLKWHASRHHMSVVDNLPTSPPLLARLTFS